MPIDSAGERRVWRWSDREKILRSADAGELAVKITSRGDHSILKKERIKPGRKPRTVWYDAKYDAASHGTKLLQHIIGERRQFVYPKSLFSTMDALHSVMGTDCDSTVLDFFAGSGTTGHATLELNRMDNGNRKYLLIEMGQYFDTVLLPRMKKVIYSHKWKNGKPSESESGTSHFIKYLRLESYEDTLNNIHYRNLSNQQKDLLEENSALREDFMLGYWIDVATKDSPSLLNIDMFDDPFSYRLDVATNDVSTTRPVDIDLIETFNLMLGLKVTEYQIFKHVKTVTGTNPREELVFIIWRDRKNVDNNSLRDFCKVNGFFPKELPHDIIYINGDHTLEDPHKKTRVTEIEFKRLMFEDTGGLTRK